MTDSILLDMDDASFAEICVEMFCHSSQIILLRCSLLEGFCCSTFCFKILQRCSVGFKPCHSFFFTFFFFKKLLCHFLSVFGIIASLRLGVVFSFSIWVPSINVISPAPLIFMQPHISALPPPRFTVGAMQSLW